MSSPIDPLHRAEQAEIAQAFDHVDPKKLLELEEKYKQKLGASLGLSIEDRQFYSEALGLIALSRGALELELDTLPVDIQSAATKMLNQMVESRIGAVKGVITTLTDPGFAPHVEMNRDRQTLETMPYAEVLVKPAQLAANQKMKELDGLILSQVQDPVKKEGLRGHLARLNYYWDTLTENVFQALWQKNAAHQKMKPVRPDDPLRRSELPKMAETFARVDPMHRKNILEDAPVKDNPGAVFMEGRIKGDGNCGFAASNFVREELLAYIKDNRGNQAVNDRNVRLAAPEVLGWLRLDSNGMAAKRLSEIPQVKDGWMKYQQNMRRVDRLSSDKSAQAGEELRALEVENDAILTELSKNSEVFHAYVDAYYNQSKGYLVLPDPGSSGMMDVIAYAKGAPIYVWRVDEAQKRGDVVDPHKVYLRHIAGPQPDEHNRSRIMHMIHRGVHFNRLIPSQEFLAGDLPKLNERVVFNGLRY